MVNRLLLPGGLYADVYEYISFVMLHFPVFITRKISAAESRKMFAENPCLWYNSQDL